jgi:1,2-diacylglycerol 3-alpha-glucosyltransferase
MNIGFVTTWLERGATYVTKAYMDMLKNGNELFVFARSGEYIDERLTYSGAKVTYGYRLKGTELDWRQFSNWIEKNNLDIVIFNEQSEIDCVYQARKKFPKLKMGAYIDYYKEDTLEDFRYYHFLLCNTKRHYNTFSWHPGAYYLPWGVNLEIFSKINNKKNGELVFFHSRGMSNRKGTDEVINAFIDGKLYKKDAKLVIHTQTSIESLISTEQANKYNIEIICKEVKHPGLYYLGDVYVYPTTLDGLGLTIYEALASGLPVITTNEAPMNEVISEHNGFLVDVASRHCRKDAYYWPLSYVDRSSLIKAMEHYIDNRNNIFEYKKNARDYAEKHLDMNITAQKLNEILNEIMKRIEEKEYKITELAEPKRVDDRLVIRQFIEILLPNFLKSKIRLGIEKRRYHDKF